MKELPILFNTEMVQAILDGRKTQTRRVVKTIAGMKEFLFDAVSKRDFLDAQELLSQPSCNHDFYLRFCPYGSPGDLLYVRETWARAMATAYRLSPGVVFTPDPDDSAVGAVYKAGWTRCAPGPWKPSIHMPKKYARIWLRVKDVRVERLQDISNEDAMAEGVYKWYMENQYDENSWSYWLPVNGSGAKNKFGEMWNAINAKRGYGWDTNPWVWVVEFEKIDK